MKKEEIEIRVIILILYYCLRKLISRDAFKCIQLGRKVFLIRYKKSVIKRIHTYKKALSRVPCFVDDSYQFYTYIEQIKRIHPGFIAGWSTSKSSPLSCHHSQHVSNTGQGPCNHAWGGGAGCNWGMEKK